MNQTHHIQSLTGVRFVFALMVVVIHNNGLLASAGITSFWLASNIIFTGYSGVSFFFILSGFILAHTYATASTHDFAMGFWWARFARVYPVYLIGLLSVASLILAKLVFENVNFAALFSYFCNLTIQGAMLQAWTPHTLMAAWNQPGWSLSAEAFFIFVFHSCFQD